MGGEVAPAGFITACPRRGYWKKKEGSAGGEVRKQHKSLSKRRYCKKTGELPPAGSSTARPRAGFVSKKRGERKGAKAPQQDQSQPIQGGYLKKQKAGSGGGGEALPSRINCSSDVTEASRWRTLPNLKRGERRLSEQDRGIPK